MRTAIVVAVLAVTSGCVTAPVQPKLLACNKAPQWWTYDQQGKPVQEIRACFLSDGRLAWRSDPAKTAAPVTPTPAALAPHRAAPAAKPK